MIKSFYVNFGPISLAFSADRTLCKVAEVLKYWLGGDDACEKSPDIEFFLSKARHKSGKDDLPRLIAGDSWLTRERFGYWDGRGWEYEFRFEEYRAVEDHAWVCSVRNGRALGIARWLPEPLLRFAHQHYFSYTEMLATTLVYRALLPIVQARLLSTGASLVHASALALKGQSAVLICGWGGAGKTSASAFLCLEKERDWAYLSDDIAIVNADGQAFRSPVPMNIFPYNTDQFPRLRGHAFSRMTRMQKAHWYLRRRLIGTGSVALRAPAINDEIPVSALPISHVLHLQRVVSSSSVIRTTEKAEVAGVSGSILMHELRQGMPMFASANSFCDWANPGLPTPWRILEDAIKTYGRAFSSAKCMSIDVPHRFGPSEVANLVVEAVGVR